MRRIRSNRANGAMISLFAVLVLLVPAQAVADDALGVAAGDVADQVAGGVADAVSGAVETTTEAAAQATDQASQVPDPVDTTTGTVTDAVDTTTNNVTDAVDNTTNNVTDAVETTSGTVTGSVNDTTSNATVAGAAAGDLRQRASDGSSAALEADIGSALEGNVRPATMTHASDPMAEQATVGTSAAPFMGAPRAEWHALLRQRSAVTSTGPANPDDPCENGVGVVCLSLLYGLGDFADAGTTVLGIMAMTGLGIVGLLLLALGLGIVGSGALVAARRRPIAVLD